MNANQKTFAVRSSATRAARQAGLTPEQYTVCEANGRFWFEEITLAAAAQQLQDSTAPATPVAPIGQDLEGDAHNYLCPHCGIHLENGVGIHDYEVNGKPVKHDKYEYECLACGGEFGAPIPAKAAKKVAKSIPHTETSTAERPCKKVWFIADEMLISHPGAKRKEVVAECVRQGVAYYTARTQYQQWLSIQKEMAARILSQAEGKK